MSETPDSNEGTKELDELNKFKVQRYLKFQELAEETYNIAIGKFDTLIISIAGGGLYVAFESLKFYKEKIPDINYSNSYLNYAGILLTAAIIINLVSQWTSFNANRYACEWSNQKLHELKKDPRFSMDDQVKFQTLKSRYNKATGFLNVVSAVLLFGGIILLGVFQFNTTFPLPIPPKVL